MEKYVVLEKAVGETPLSCAEAWREAAGVDASVPLAYAGRLDPMASGKLLVLVGDECKNQTNYHGLDKDYKFSVLLGIASDSLDVLGRLQTCQIPEDITPDTATPVIEKFVGDIELPYPRFSAKTVQGKPLHMWTLEGRLDEIEIPTKASTIYSLTLTSIDTLSRQEVATQARAKIDTIPPVTEARKALGNDFRRVDVRQDWENIQQDDTLPEQYTILNFHCVASSGTYMRTLASRIAESLNTCGLAWSIHRDKIGTYDETQQRWTTDF